MPGIYTVNVLPARPLARQEGGSVEAGSTGVWGSVGALGDSLFLWEKLDRAQWPKGASCSGVAYDVILCTLGIRTVWKGQHVHVPVMESSIMAAPWRLGSCAKDRLAEGADWSLCSLVKWPWPFKLELVWWIFTFLVHDLCTSCHHVGIFTYFTSGVCYLVPNTGTHEGQDCVAHLQQCVWFWWLNLIFSRP